jgi:hypothetical protein
MLAQMPVPSISALRLKEAQQPARELNARLQDWIIWSVSGVPNTETISDR